MLSLSPVLPAALTAVAGVAIGWNAYGNDILTEMRRQVRRLDNQTAKPGSLKFKLQRLGIEHKIIVLTSAVVGVLGFLAGALFLNNIVAGIMLAVCLPLFIRDLIEVRYKKYLSHVDEQAETMLLMCSSLYKTRKDIVEALAQTAECLPDPMRYEVAVTVGKYRAGKPLDQALLSFAERIQNKDIEVFARGIILSEHYGTDTGEVLKGVSATINDRIMLREELKNELQGQSLTIAILLALAPALLVLSMFLISQVRNSITQTLPGKILVCAVIAVEYVAWRIASSRGVTL